MLRVASVSPFPPDRNGGGGPRRQAHLLAGLAEHASLELICVGPVNDPLVRAAAETIVTVPVPAGWRDDHRWRRRGADLAAVLASRSPMEVRAFGPVRDVLRPALADLAADVVLLDLVGLAPLLPKRRSVPWVLTFHNLPSRMAAQQAPIMPRPRQRWLLEHDAQTALAYERRAAAGFDAVITCTDADAEALAGSDGRLRSRIHVVANGVDLDRAPLTPLPSAPRVVFTGSMYTHPNIDAAIWLCREVLPLLRQEEPAIQVDLVGARPPPVVRALAELPGVRVHADVAHVSPFLQTARVSVVPIRVGSGSRLKALEAMAAGRPVVGTSIGLEGLELRAGRDALVADDPAGFAAAVVRVLRDDQLAMALAAAGRVTAEERFGWPAIEARFATLILELAAAQTGRPVN